MQEQCQKKMKDPLLQGLFHKRTVWENIPNFNGKVMCGFLGCNGVTACIFP